MGDNTRAISPRNEASNFSRRPLASSGTIKKASIRTQRSVFMSETRESERPALPMKGVPQPARDEVLDLPRVHISTHPVIRHKMTALRDKNTPPPAFYRLVKEIGALLAYEATATLHLEDQQIET